MNTVGLNDKNVKSSSNTLSENDSKAAGLKVCNFIIKGTPT